MAVAAAHATRNAKCPTVQIIRIALQWACVKLVDVVEALPKTRSGKILRRTMRGIAHGKDEPMPSTIEDHSVLHALRPTLQSTAPG